MLSSQKKYLRFCSPYVEIVQSYLVSAETMIDVPCAFCEIEKALQLLTNFFNGNDFTIFPPIENPYYFFFLKYQNE